MDGEIRLGVVGSRFVTAEEEKLVYEKIDEFYRDIRVTCIVSGGATGVDTVAIQYAKENKIPYKVFKPDFELYHVEKYGYSAYYHRNEQIVDYSDVIMAFPRGESKGTKLTMKIAEETGRKLIFHRLDCL